MRSIKTYILFFFLLVSSFVSSQNQASKWYFGNGAALDFMTNPPTILNNSALSSNFRSSCIADASGNLLFYTDGNTVWNSNHVTMANGTGLLGYSPVIVQNPANASLYYIFTVAPSNTAICYSTVDMSLAAGLGSVTVKNAIITLNQSITSNLTITKHCNGTDYWLLCHENTSNNFCAFLITSLGISSSPVVSPVGTIYGVNNTSGGSIKISPNRKKIATVVLINTSCSVELYDFDAAFGTVSNSLTIFNSSVFTFVNEDIAFSSDVSKLYGTNYYTDDKILQWDLCAGSATAIAASLYSVNAGSSMVRWGIDLAIDGKIYVSRYNQQTLGVINNPNTAGAGCNYVDLGQSIAPNSALRRLINFPSNYFFQKPVLSPFTYTNTSCQTVSFTSPPAPFTNTVFSGCSASSYSILGTMWDFGDPASGSANTSTLTNPTHFYPSTGTYTAKLIYYYSCGGGTDTLKQQINVTPCVSTSSGSCYGMGSATVSSTGSGVYTYTWLPGNQTGSVAANLTAGTYTLNVHEQNSNFTFTLGTYTISTPPAITVNVSSSSPTVCANSNLTLSANASGGTGAFTYTWQSAGTGSNYTVSQNVGNYVYTVTVTDSNTCTASNTISVDFIANPVLTVTPTQSICPNFQATLNVSGANTYTWLPVNVISNSISVSPTSTSVYSVTGTSTVTGCESTTTTQVFVYPVPTLSFTTYSITCANLGSATVTPSGGYGTYNYTWQPTNQTTSVATNLNPNTYTVTVFDVGTGCYKDSTVTFSSLIPLTGDLNNDTLLLCNSINTGTANFTNLSGGSGTENYLWTNGTITLTTNTVNTLSAGQWSVTVTDALTACQINSVFTISQPPALTLNISANTPTACASNSITLTGTTSGGTGTNYLYTWVNGASTFSQNVSETIAGTYVYTLTSTDENTCSITETISVDFIPNPTLTVSDVSICPLETATLTASGANSYTWTSPQNTFSYTNTFADNPLTTSIYTVTGEALACTSQTTATIFLKNIPTLTITPTSTVCENHSFNFSAGTGTSYVWSGVSGFASNNAINAINSSQLNQTGIYNVTVTSANSCTASTNFSLTVNPLPVISISPNSPSLCLNTNDATLTASGVADTYSWFPQTNLSNYNTANVLANPNTNTTYSLITSLNNCTVMNTVLVAVIPPPSLTISLSSPSMCAQAFNGSPNTITLTPNGANTYTLITPNNVSNPPSPTGSVQISSQPPYVPTGLATATIYGSNGVCTVSTTANFSITPNPTISVNNPTPVICAGETYTYTSQGATSYTWTSETPNSTIYSYGNIAVTNPSINSVFSVVGGSLGCLSSIVSTTITVNPIPTLEIIPQPTYVCLNSAITLSAQGTSGNTYTWLPSFMTGNQLYVNATDLQTKTYTVVASLNNCTNSAVASLSVKPLPTAQLSILKNGKCVNDSLVLKGSGGISYSWILPNGNSIAGEELRIKTTSQNFSGTYTLIVYDENSCAGTKTQSVTINPLPNGFVSAQSFTGCMPLCNEYVFVPSNQSTALMNITWNMNNKNFSGNNIKYCFNETGTHNIETKLKDQNSCTNTITTQVVVYPKPNADFSFSPKEPIENFDEVQFTNTSKAAEKYTWNFSVINETSSEKNPKITFENTGTYVIALVAQSDKQCLDTIIKSIYVRPDFTVFVPNVFSPNGDNLNDVFIPVTRGTTQFHLQIFNRWGQVVFESSDVSKGWDGTFQGEPCKLDVYVWKLTVSNSKEEKELSGTVMLER